MLINLHGATSYSARLDSRSEYFHNIEKALSEAAAKGLEASIVLRHQGESNANRSESEASFSAQLSQLLDRFLELPSAPGAQILLYRAAICSGARAAKNLVLFTARTGLAIADLRIVKGPHTGPTGLRTLRLLSFQCPQMRGCRLF